MEMLSPILTATDVVNRKYVDDSIPTLTSLMGSSAIGTTSAYPYWTGSAWATKSLGTFAFKSSLAFSELASKPTTIAGYGITDAITTANIGSQSVAYATSAGSATTAASCTGNAATATKLATAKTIWGQSFDGTSNISGDLLLGYTATLSTTDSSGSTLYTLQLNDSNTLLFGQYTAKQGYDTIIYGNNIRFCYSSADSSSYTGFYLNSSGNVGIGTTSPAYKLDVAGTGRFTGAVTASSTIQASSVICGTESLRVNAADNAGNFGYMRVETVSSNRGLVHIGANYGGNTTITNTSVRVDAIGLYRDVVGIGRTYTYDELYANQAAGKSLQVDGSTQITGNLCVGASYSADGAAGAAAVVIRSEGGIEISHASTPYIDFHYANGTSDYSVRLINKASNTLNLYGHFCGGTNETYSLGTSSLRWHTLYTSYINAVGTSTLATAAITTLKIGSATLTYDSTAGALKIDGNVYATGQVAAGGAGAEGAASGGYGPVTIDMQALSELVEVQDVMQTTMDALGLTQEVAGDMLDGIYTKVVCTNSDGYRECWSYDAYESAFYIRIFIRQGDTYDINTGYSLTYDRQAGTWSIYMGEV